MTGSEQWRDVCGEARVSELLVQVLLEHGARDVAVLGGHIMLERDHDPRGVRARSCQGERQVEEVAALSKVTISVAFSK